jgi:hypothetical protein
VHHVGERGQLGRGGRGELDEGGQHTGRGVDREDQLTAHNGRMGEQLDLGGGHDAELAAGPAQRPEQLGIDLGRHADPLAGRGHQLDRPDRARGHAVVSPEPRQAAAEQVAQHGDARVGGGQRDQAGAVEPGVQVGPAHAGSDPGDPSIGVDGDVLQRRRPYQHRPVGGAGRRAVAARLHGDGEAFGRGLADGGHRVGGVGQRHHRERVLADREVPRLAVMVPGGVARTGHGTGDRGVERGESRHASNLVEGYHHFSPIRRADLAVPAGSRSPRTGPGPPPTG